MSRSGLVGSDSALPNCLGTVSVSKEDTPNFHLPLSITNMPIIPSRSFILYRLGFPCLQPSLGRPEFFLFILMSLFCVLCIVAIVLAASAL